MDQAFTVVVASNACEDFFPGNKNFSFSNVFPAPINVSNYEVALSSLTYYDRFIKSDPAPIPEPDPTPTEFFDLTKKENEILVEKTQKNTINFLKSNPDLPSFIAEVITECAKSNINIALSQQFVNNKIIRTQLIVTTREGWKVQITDPLLSIIGFEQSEFATGTYNSTLTVDYQAFEKIPLNNPIGTIVLFKRDTSAIYLSQIVGTPTISGILGKVVVAMSKAGHNVSLLLRKKARVIIYKGFALIRMNLSKKTKRFHGNSRELCV